MFRPGYAIEYDYFPPDQLKHTLESKDIENLFFAGQWPTGFFSLQRNGNKFSLFGNLIKHIEHNEQ